MSTNRISAIVKERRKALGITQHELAQKAGVGLRFIRDLEQGKPTVQVAKVNQVLFMFGLELGAVPVDRERLLNEKG
ncbi:MAG: transcriptional regulator [Erysipelotrichia bacterium]|nr:transcriptional regulator [Erysipelotrichia bacterium]